MKKREDLILTAGPSITKKEISYVTDAVTNGWNDQWNKYITKLETQFSDYIGVKHAISTTSCTGALHLALKGIGIGEGDEVIIFTPYWVSFPDFVAVTGATPVFVKTDPSHQFEPVFDDLQSKICSSTKVIIINSPSNPTGGVW